MPSSCFLGVCSTCSRRGSGKAAAAAAKSVVPKPSDATSAPPKQEDVEATTSNEHHAEESGGSAGGDVFAELRERCSTLESGLNEGERRRAELAKALEAERAARRKDVLELKATLGLDEQAADADAPARVQVCFANLVRSIRELQSSIGALHVHGGSSCGGGGIPPQLDDICRIAAALVAVLPADDEGGNCCALEQPSPRPEVGGHPRGGKAVEADGSTDAGSVDLSKAHVLFSVACDAPPGFHVHVVGADAELGFWDPALGLRLQTSPGTSPTWRSSRGIYVKAGACLEYKYVLVNDDQCSAHWEDGSNRSVEVASPASCVVLSDVFGAPAASAAEVLREPPEWASEPCPSDQRSIGSEVDESQAGDQECEPECASGSSRDDFSLPVPKQEVAGSGIIDNESLPEHLCSGGVGAEAGGDEPVDSLAKPYLVEAMVPGPDFAAARYSLVGDRPLGEGSFGYVWRCSRAQSHQDYAVKIINRSCLKPRDLDNLVGQEGEIRLHSALYHPNIVRLYECFDETETVEMVMECCLGGDLFDAVETTRENTGHGFSEAATARVMQHLLSALAYLHRLTFAHRDVKAENVLLSRACVAPEENIYKLCDFGFAARDLGNGKGLSGAMGSPFTVAPEVIAGSPYGCPVDLWSAGVLMYMTLSGAMPFNGTTRSEVLHKVAAAAYSLEGTPWAKLQETCKSLLAGLLSRLPEDRPSAPKALQHVWLAMFAESTRPSLVQQ